MSGPGTPGRSTARRRRAVEAAEGNRRELGPRRRWRPQGIPHCGPPWAASCLLYTSDAADDM
eukprot:14571343-Alexandrium_andersonii.AAC.1